MLNFLIQVWEKCFTPERIAGYTMIAIGYLAIKQPELDLVSLISFLDNSLFATIFIVCGGGIITMNWNKFIFNDNPYDVLLKIFLLTPLFFYAGGVIDHGLHGNVPGTSSVIYSSFYLIVLRSILDLEKLHTWQKEAIELRDKINLNGVTKPLQPLRSQNEL